MPSSTILNDIKKQLDHTVPEAVINFLDSSPEQEIMAMDAATLHEKIAFIDPKVLLQAIDDLEPLLQRCWHDKLYVDMVPVGTVLIKLMLMYFKLQYNMTGNARGMSFKFDSPTVGFFPPQKAFENELKTGLSRYYNLRGNAYLMMGENLKAIDDYDWALGIEGLTEPWVALCNRSLANTNLGRLNEAEKDLLDARRIAPRPIKAVEDLLVQLEKSKANHNPFMERHDSPTNKLQLLVENIRRVINNLFPS